MISLCGFNIHRILLHNTVSTGIQYSFFKSIIINWIEKDTWACFGFYRIVAMHTGSNVEKLTKRWSKSVSVFCEMRVFVENGREKKA